MAIKEPVPFCDEPVIYPVPGEATINLVFGLPPVQYDPSCRGLPIAVPDLMANLAAVYPIIRLADCIMKVIAVVQAIPDSIGPPPDPTALIQKLNELTDCITLLLQFSVFGAIPDFCRFIRDLIGFLITVLNCVIDTLVIYQEVEEEITVLDHSQDERLRDTAACLRVHNGALGGEINFKFNSVAVFINIINLLTAAMPPPVGGNPPIVITVPLTLDSQGLTQLQDIVDVLTIAQAPFIVCAGG